MTIRPGLCSITFRQLDVAAVVELCLRAGVEGVEWGGDVHVAAGDLDAARSTRRRCEGEGLEVVSYGSYYGMHDAEDSAAEAERVLDTAAQLDAPLVRIWAELGVGPDAAGRERARVVERTHTFAAAARARGLTVALEFHRRTLTETAQSALALLGELALDNVLTHWQPDPVLRPQDAVDELRLVLPRLAHLHVFSWGRGDERLPLAAGAALWRPALALAAKAPPPAGSDRFALLEFVRGDEPDQLVADVAELRRWLAAVE